MLRHGIGRLLRIVALRRPNRPAGLARLREHVDMRMQGTRRHVDDAITPQGLRDARVADLRRAAAVQDHDHRVRRPRRAVVPRQEHHVGADGLRRQRMALQTGDVFGGALDQPLGHHTREARRGLERGEVRIVLGVFEVLEARLDSILQRVQRVLGTSGQRMHAGEVVPARPVARVGLEPAHVQVARLVELACTQGRNRLVLERRSQHLRGRGRRLVLGSCLVDGCGAAQQERPDDSNARHGAQHPSRAPP